jgi:D-aminopeptidase
MIAWREIWRGIGAGARVAQLEAEVARLRGENRALMNSILGIAGVPPVIVSGDEEATVDSAGIVAVAEKRAPRKSVTPMRRRSWHQVNRMLELDAARKRSAKNEE